MRTDLPGASRGSALGEDGSIRELDGLSLKYCDIAVAAGKLGRSIEVLPYATRALFENVCRSHALGGETAAGL